MGVLAVQQNGAVGGLIHLGQQIENGGLAGAVRADQTGDLGAADDEVEVFNSLQTAKGDAQTDALQNGALAGVTLGDQTDGRCGDQLGFTCHLRYPPLLSSYLHIE